MNLASIDYQEKRDFVRMKMETPISVTIEQNTDVEGICHNLSGGGLLVSLPEPLCLGDKVVVTVSSNHKNSPMLKALTTVRRVESPFEQSCAHGLKIEEMLE